MTAAVSYTHLDVYKRQISLGTSTTKGVTFTPIGGGSLSMGAAIFGTAAGQGGLLGTTGFYSLSTPSPVMLTLGPSFGPLFADYAASGTLNFEITLSLIHI